MNGLELAGAVNDRWPLIGLIITSGYFQPKEDDLPLGSVFFAKPFDERRVAEALRDLLI